MGPKFNGPQWDNLPWLSADGLTLWFNTFVPQGGEWSLRMSKRASRDKPWSDPITLSSGVGVTDDDNPSIIDVTLSGDWLSRVFTNGFGLWLSTRSSKNAPWSKGRSIGPPLDYSKSAKRNATAPFLSADARTLLFASDRPGGHGQHDLWMTRRVKKK